MAQPVAKNSMSRRRAGRNRPKRDVTPQASSASQEDLPKFGSEIRGLRKQAGMTLAQLSKGSGLSVSFLSQVERDASNLSVTALYKVARALGVNLGWFFHAAESGLNGEADFIVRARNRRHLRYASGIFDELLVPHLNGALALFRIQFAPGAFSGETKVAPGSEHAGLVLEGELELTLNGRRILLKPGDSFAFEGSNPHRYGNPGKRATVVVWAHTPPTY
jgi:transcriptional regulator with XRE-family HTH domain